MVRDKIDSMAKKIDFLFLFIVTWCVISTTVLTQQYWSKAELQELLIQPKPPSHRRKQNRLTKAKTNRLQDANNLMDTAPDKDKNESHGGLTKAKKNQFESEDVKNVAGKTPNEDKRKRQHGHIKDTKNLNHEPEKQQDNDHDAKLQARPKASTAVNQFPFTRDLTRFTRSRNFYLYVVELTSATTNNDSVNAKSDADTQSSPQSPLQWSEVRWKDLVINWGRNTTFSNLLDMSTPLHPKKENNDNNNQVAREKSREEGMIEKKLILHCLPKAASTTLRRACYKNQKESCEALDFPKQQDPYGYRNIDEFFRAVKVCDDIDHFCVQGGDANMGVINHEGKGGSASEEEGDDDDERDPLHFVHMVPFRNFDDWVESAIKQIFFIDGGRDDCGRVGKILDECLGYRELYMELYPKSVLSLLIGMAFDARGNGISHKDKHHIMLYNYKDVDSVMTKVSEFFGMDPLPRTDKRLKQQIVEGTCPKEISEKFHECHDKTLMNADAIRGLEAERLRRKKNDKRMKTIIGRDKQQEKEGSENS